MIRDVGVAVGSKSRETHAADCELDSEEELEDNEDKEGHSRVIPWLNVRPVGQLAEPPENVVTPWHPLNRERYRVFPVHAVGVKVPV